MIKGTIDSYELWQSRPENLNENMEDLIESAENRGWNQCNRSWIKTIEEQPRVGEWIPVSEREPKEPEDGFKRYIVQRASNAEPRSLYWDQYGTWLDEEGTPYTDIIAWMPLPEPYKERNEE